MSTQMRHKQIRNVILSCLCLLTLLLAACRSASSTVEIKAEISPEPIVGEIVTLRIEAVSEKYSGDGEMTLIMSDEINFISGAPEWERASATNGTSSETYVGEMYVWHGQLVANEPQIQEVSICVTQPGNWVVYYSAVVGLGDEADSQLHIISTADSAKVIPSSDYNVLQVPEGSTPTPTPVPVTVSSECLVDS